jgi:hypothetical protein
MRHSLQFPGIFTATGQPEAVLYPSNTNRTRSTDLEKGVLSPRQHRPDGMRQEFDTVMADTQTIARQNSAQDATYGGLSTFVPPSSLAHNDSTAATQGSNTPQPDRGEQMDQSYVSDNSIHAHAKRTTIGQVETMLPSHSDPVRERASPPARAPVVSWGPGGLAYIVDHSDDSNEAAGAEDANAGASVADQSDNRDTSEGTCSPLSVATQESEGASIQRTGPHTLSIDHIQTLVRIAKASVSTLRLPRSEVHIFDAAGHIRRAGGIFRNEICSTCWRRSFRTITSSKRIPWLAVLWRQAPGSNADHSGRSWTLFRMRSFRATRQAPIPQPQSASQQRRMLNLTCRSTKC